MYVLMCIFVSVCLCCDLIIYLINIFNKLIVSKALKFAYIRIIFA